MGFTVNVTLIPAQPGVEVELWGGPEVPNLRITSELTDAAGYVQFIPVSSVYPIFVQVRVPALGLVSEVVSVMDEGVVDFVL